MQNVIFTQVVGQSDRDFSDEVGAWLKIMESEKGGRFHYTPFVTMRGPLMIVTIFYEWVIEEDE